MCGAKCPVDNVARRRLAGWGFCCPTFATFALFIEQDSLESVKMSTAYNLFEQI